MPNQTDWNIEHCETLNFMLRDGVCDKVTNNEECNWDGGDCCLDISLKDETLCQVGHFNIMFFSGFKCLLKLSRIAYVNGQWILSSILGG